MAAFYSTRATASAPKEARPMFVRFKLVVFSRSLQPHWLNSEQLTLNQPGGDDGNYS